MSRLAIVTVLAAALVCPLLGCASAPAATITTTITAAGVSTLAPTNYIVGYGSLMEDGSRQRTAPDAQEAYPVIVDDFVRGWFSQGESGNLGITYLGAIAKPSAKIWAVIYDVSPAGLQATDEREGIYERVEVRRDQLHLFKGMHIAQNAKIWIYVAPDETQVRKPDADHPIVQSYVDIFINGCFELEERYQIEDFAVHCLATTQDWSKHWVNDRIYPRRPFIYEPNSGKIDKLLEADSRTSDYFMGSTLE